MPTCHGHHDVTFKQRDTLSDQVVSTVQQALCEKLADSPGRNFDKGVSVSKLKPTLFRIGSADPYEDLALQISSTGLIGQFTSLMLEESPL